MNLHLIQKSIYLKARPEAVFDALTSSAEIIRFFPLRKVTSEWVVGGEILLEGEIGGTPFTDHGSILALDRPSRFIYSYWSDNHGTERTPENHLTIAYRLSAVDQGTLLEVEHGEFKSQAMFEAMQGAWDSLLQSLAAHVEPPGEAITQHIT